MALNMASMLRYPPKKLIKIIGLSVFLAVAAFLVIGYFGYIAAARSGKDIRITYDAYHRDMLGAIIFGGCKIKIAEPWYPWLDDYHSLTVNSRELIFVDRNAPLENGKAVSVSFIRSLANLPADFLQKPVKVGEVMAQFVRPDMEPDPSKSRAWLPAQQFYLVSKKEGKLRDALAATKFDDAPGEACSKH